MPGCPCESECQAGRQALRCNRLRNVAAAAGAADPGPRRRGRLRDFAEPLPCHGHRHKAFRLTPDRANPPHQRLHQTRLTFTARKDISDHLDRVATLMWISRQAAKFYVTDDVIGDMADRIARAVQQHQPIDVDAERRRRR